MQGPLGMLEVKRGNEPFLPVHSQFCLGTVLIQPSLTSNSSQTDTRCYLSYRDLIQRTFCCWLYPSHLSADLSHLISHSVQPPRSCSWFVSSSIKPDLIPGNGEQCPFLGSGSWGDPFARGIGMLPVLSWFSKKTGT